MKVAKFDGSVCLGFLLVHFEVCACHNGSQDVDRADFLRCALEKSATQILLNFGARQDVTYDELVSRLESATEMQNRWIYCELNLL